MDTMKSNSETHKGKFMSEKIVPISIHFEALKDWDCILLEQVMVGEMVDTQFSISFPVHLDDKKLDYRHFLYLLIIIYLKL